MYIQLVSSYLELLQHADQNNKNAGDEEDRHNGAPGGPKYTNVQTHTDNCAKHYKGRKNQFALMRLPKKFCDLLLKYST